VSQFAVGGDIGLRNFRCSADQLRPIKALGQKQIIQAAETKARPVSCVGEAVDDSERGLQTKAKATPVRFSIFTS